MSHHAQSGTDATDFLQQAWDIVRMTEEIVGVDDLCPAGPGADPQATDAALSAARHALTRRLELTSVSRKFRDQASLAALALRAEQAQVALKDMLLGTQRVRLESVQNAINGLRGATTAAALVERIPTEVYRMGFSRVLFSRIQNGMWLTCSAFAGADLEMASKMVEAGLAHPRQLAGPLLESEMVRHGAPILVTDPQTHPGVHPELLEAVQTPAYVAAPVFSWGKPIGLVHADRQAGAARVTEFDRDVLGMFAAGLGLAFERNLMIGRLRAMRRAAQEHARLAGALADDLTLDVIDSAGPALSWADDVVGRASAGGDDAAAAPLSGLTSREAEVLRAIAAGKTNAQIAASLYVTEGTIKSHVKHILRKMGASNRTEAVAKYHRARGR
ncbi:transcriptional regulator, LuxR family [Mycolicibacterium rhodesiae JS60]|nr:transcriptional regulator, LuxR family [Mycolicibacterium rhodesiae JS60]